MRVISLTFIVCLSLHVKGQYTEQSITIPNVFSEASGIVAINDTTFIIHNDGGDEPTLYVINQFGKLLNTCRVSNATNEDWEDLTRDGMGNLYVGDFGNNLNTRQDLKIYKVNESAVLNQHQVSAEVIRFHYQEQHAFPPKDEELDFDCEALTYAEGKLHLYTKSRSKPWHGYTFHYELPPYEGDYEINRMDSIFIGKSGWMFDCVTGASSNDQWLYLLTYNRLVVLDKLTYKKQQEIHFKGYTQKEGITHSNTGKVFIVAEKQRFIGGPYFYIIDDDRD